MGNCSHCGLAFDEGEFYCENCGEQLGTTITLEDPDEILARRKVVQQTASRERLFNSALVLIYSAVVLVFLGIGMMLLRVYWRPINSSIASAVQHTFQSANPAGAAQPGKAQAAVPPPGATPSLPLIGVIYYIVNENGQSRLARINPDGTRQAYITNEHEHIAALDATPDGRLLVYCSDGGSNLPNIYRIDSNGANRQRLTDTNDATAPAFYPGSMIITFLRQETQVFSLDLLTGNFQDTTMRNSTVIFGRAPDHWIAWVSNSPEVDFNNATDTADTTLYLHMVQASGDNHQVLATGPAFQSLAFSPGCQRVAYVAPGDGIYIAKIDGGGTQRLTSNSADAHPVFSPNGAYLLFTRDDNGKSLWIKDTTSDTPPVKLTAGAYGVWVRGLQDGQ